MEINFELLDKHVFVTKLAGFEHSEYIQNNETKTKVNNDDVPLVQGKNIRNGFFVDKYDWFIKKEISDKLTRSKLTKDCILVPYVGSNLGEVGIFYHDYDCHLASNIAKIELIDDYFDIEFLKYYLQSPIGQGYLFQGKQGSAQPNITMESIRNTNVILLPPNTQKKIASILKCIDSKIINNNKIKTELEAVANLVYDRWFLQFEFKNSLDKPYKSNGGEMIFNADLKREIPIKWISTTLKETTIMYQPEAFDAKQILKTGPNRVYGAGGFMGYFNSYNHENTEIFISCRGSCGNIYRSMPKSLITGNAMVVHPNKEALSNYLYLTLKRFGVKKCITGSVQPQITRDNLNDWVFCLPDMDTLLKFNSLIESAFKKIELITNENDNLISLRNFLLPLLMNGQITFKEH